MGSARLDLTWTTAQVGEKGEVGNEDSPRHELNTARGLILMPRSPSFDNHLKKT